jgi:hypothetical protein
MHPEMERELVAQRIEELRRAGAQTRRDRISRAVRVDREVVLRGVRSSDRSAVAALAALDGTLPPLGPALAAEVDGGLVAVLPLDGGRPFADPFRRTSDLIALLEERARQLDVARQVQARSRRPFAWFAPALRRLV